LDIIRRQHVPLDDILKISLGFSLQLSAFLLETSLFTLKFTPLLDAIKDRFNSNWRAMKTFFG